MGGSLPAARQRALMAAPVSTQICIFVGETLLFSNWAITADILMVRRAKFPRANPGPGLLGQLERLVKRREADRACGGWTEGQASWGGEPVGREGLRLWGLRAEPWASGDMGMGLGRERGVCRLSVARRLAVPGWPDGVLPASSSPGSELHRPCPPSPARVPGAPA